MKKKKLFGNNIVPSCSYCSHSKHEGATQYCDANRTLKNGKCKKFNYNPIMRSPYGMAPLPKYDKKEFQA